MSRFGAGYKTTIGQLALDFDLGEAFAAMKAGGHLAHPVVFDNRLRVSAGYVRFGTISRRLRMVKFNGRLAKAEGLEALRYTVAHELAHVAMIRTVSIRDPHGSDWVVRCLEFGGDGHWHHTYRNMVEAAGETFPTWWKGKTGLAFHREARQRNLTKLAEEATFSEEQFHTALVKHLEEVK